MRAEADQNTFNIRRSTALMIGGTALIVCGCVGAILWILSVSTRSVDSTAAYGESRLLHSVIATYQAELSKAALAYATWDDMFDNFAKRRRPIWEKANLGPRITTQLGIDYVAVVAKDGAVTYLYAKKQQEQITLSPADQARLVAVSDLALRSPIPPEGTPVRGALIFDGQPVLIAASPIISSRGEAPAFALIEMRALNAHLLLNISKGFGITGLKVVPSSGADLSLDAAMVGAPKLALVWTPAKEGRQLFARVLPVVVFTGLLLLLIFSVLLVLWRTIVEQMRASEARAMSAEVAAAQTRALAAEETAHSKNAFIANMNHELRTPLNAILGFSQIIQSESLGPIGVPKYREYIQDIHDAGAHLMGIINDILTVSKIDAGKFAPKLEAVPFRNVLGEVVRMMEVIASERDIWINTIRCNTDVNLFVDRNALRQVMINVLANAIKFSPEGYGIEVEGDENPDGTFELRIIDYGCGIPPDTLKDIGKPFVQAETAYTRNYQGTGLGLSICYRLVEAMGGKIEVKSTVKKGTAVHIILKTDHAEPRAAVA